LLSQSVLPENRESKLTLRIQRTFWTTLELRFTSFTQSAMLVLIMIT